MDIALFPKDCSEELAAALAIGGIRPTHVDSLELTSAEAISQWSVLVVELGDEPMRRLRHIGEMVETSGLPVLAVVHPAQLPLVEQATGVADFIAHPPDSAEIGTRLRMLAQTATSGEAKLSYQDLELIEHRRRVWTREQLLSKVWGYDYFGGARTVDVHVRRLRAKLGEHRAGWIVTVRSVGYRFG